MSNLSVLTLAPPPVVETMQSLKDQLQGFKDALHREHRKVLQLEASAQAAASDFYEVRDELLRLRSADREEQLEHQVLAQARAVLDRLDRLENETAVLRSERAAWHASDIQLAKRLLRQAVKVLHSPR
jgi:hypothetical protein